MILDTSNADYDLVEGPSGEDAVVAKGGRVRSGTPKSQWVAVFEKTRQATENIPKHPKRNPKTHSNSLNSTSNALQLSEHSTADGTVPGRLAAATPQARARSGPAKGMDFGALLDFENDEEGFDEEPPPPEPSAAGAGGFVIADGYAARSIYFVHACVFVFLASREAQDAFWAV